MRGCEGARASVGLDEFAVGTATWLVRQISLLTGDGLRLAT
jgi:hypothetical protein